MAKNISLSSLLPAIIKNPATPPLIDMRAPGRDGTRPGNGGGNGNPVDWNARLAKTGTGTPDPTFNPATDITYVGAFRIPHFSNGITSSAIKNAMVYKPPEVGGRNGVNGSIFMGGAGAGDSGWVAEVQIPDWSNTINITDHTQLPTTTVLQNFVSVLSKAPIPDLVPEDPVKIPGAMQFIGDTLYMSFYAYYEAGGINDSNVLVCNDAKDLENSTYIGFLSRTGRDRGSKYTVEIPADKQAAFGGATHFVGAWASHSIIGRSSFGPALYAWNPVNIQSDDTSITATEWTMYGSALSTNVEFWSYEGIELINYYTAQIPLPDGRATTLKQYMNYDPALRVSDPSIYPLPDVSLHPGSGHDTQIQCAFIPPGTNTIVFIGSNEGSRYGSLYKAHTWEKGNLNWETNPNSGESGGYGPASVYDRDNMFWTINLMDVANRVEPHDPKIIKQGIFDNNRWLVRENQRTRGEVCSGSFDPQSGRLYVMHQEVYQNQYNYQYIVSVYQVGGGN